MSSVASRLNEPISSVDELVTLLSPILASLSLLPSSLTPPPLDPPTPASLLKRQLSQIQSTLITSLWLTWEHALDPQLPAQLLFRPLLVPPPDAPFATEIALSAYNTIISLLSSSSSSTTKHSPTGPLHHAPTLILVATLLKDLHLQYKLDNLARVVFKTGTTQLELQRWTAVLRDLVQVPTKVANAAGAFLPYRCDIPQELIWSNYFSTLSQSFPTLLLSLSAPAPALSLTLSQLLLHAPHLFSPSLSPSPTPSFFSTLLPPLLPLPFPSPPELLIARASAALLLRDALSDLPHRDLVKILLALFSTLDQYLAKHPSKNAGKGAAWILSEVLGDVANENEVAEVAWEVVLDPKKEWSVELARALALWTGKVGTTEVEDRERVVARVAKVWCDPSGINDSSVPSRLFSTTLLLSLLPTLPSLSPSTIALSHSPTFLTAISTHLSLLRPIPRLLGMLTAEVVSAHTVAPGGPVKPLDFGPEVWNAGGDAVGVVRELRESFLGTKEEEEGDGWQEELRAAWPRAGTTTPTPPPPSSTKPTPLPSSSTSPPVAPSAPTKRPLISIIHSSSDSDSEDDLLPYPLPAAPSAPYLSTLSSTDPSEYATALPSTKATPTRPRGSLRPPVYVPELVAYLRGKDPEGREEQADEEAERIEVGLKEAERLVRRKTGWGGELEENAVELAFVLIGLTDQFETDDFDRLRLAALAALVAAVPTKVAPALIEQYFFPHYSVSQRYTLLTALALGARELAGIPALPPLPPSSTSTPTPSLPIEPLFPSKQLPPSLHRRLVGPSPSTPPPPPAPTSSAQLDQLSSSLSQSALSSTRTSIESSLPDASRSKLLTVRRFASAPSPSSSSPQNGKPTFSLLSAEFFLGPLINRFWDHLKDASTNPNARPYAQGGASTPTLLDPIILSRYLTTLSVLLHASRHSPHFLSFLAPQALELVLALRSPSTTEPTVLSGQMEVLLVVFDAIVEIDGGYCLMRTVEGGAGLVGDCREWAGEVFEVEEGRSGKEGVGRAGRAAAGTLLRLDEIERRWRGAVGW